MQGFTTGYDKLTFAFDEVQIYADGKMSSAFVDERTPSLILNIANELRLHAGATIQVTGFINYTEKSNI